MPAIIRRLFVVCLLLLASSANCDLKWDKIESDGICIEYCDGMRDIACKMLPELARVVQKSPSTDSEVEIIKRNRQEILQYIATRIGLDKPGAAMTACFDGLIEKSRWGKSTFDVFDMRHFKLWRKDILKRQLIAGKSIEGFGYDSRKDLIIWQYSIPTQRPSARSAYPLIVSDIFPTSDAISRVESALKRPPGMSPAIMHEVVEQGLCMDAHLDFAFRRWFCEGVSDVIAEECVKKFIGDCPSDNDTNKYASMRSQVDLKNWRAAEYDDSMPGTPTGEICLAHYAFARQEVEGLVARNGSDSIPSIIRRLTAASHASSSALYDAIKSVTGEDFVQRLSSYGKISQDNLPGIAVTNFTMASLSPDSDGSWPKSPMPDSIYLPLDGETNLGVASYCETFDTPIQIDLELRSPSGLIFRIITKYPTTRQHVALVLDMKTRTQNLTPGRGLLRVRICGKVYREIPIELITGG